MKAANLKKASGNAKINVGSITAEQCKEIAEYKMPDLNANTIEGAMRIVAGTARSMGVTVEGMED